MNTLRKKYSVRNGIVYDRQGNEVDKSLFNPIKTNKETNRYFFNKCQ
jgi:hypothetical protein